MRLGFKTCKATQTQQCYTEFVHLCWIDSLRLTHRCVTLTDYIHSTGQKNQIMLRFLLIMCSIKCSMSYPVLLSHCTLQLWILTWACARLPRCWTSSTRSDGSSLSQPRQLPIIITASRWLTYRWGMTRRETGGNNVRGGEDTLWQQASVLLSRLSGAKQRVK